MGGLCVGFKSLWAYMSEDNILKGLSVFWPVFMTRYVEKIY